MRKGRHIRHRRPIGHPFPWLILLVVFTFFTANKISGQHQAHYSQYMFNGLLINPAYAGSKGMLQATALYRSQWTGFPGAPRTATVSLHSTTRNLRNNYGLTFLHDRIGANQRSGFQAAYAYRLDLGAATLAFGLQGGMTVFATDHRLVATTDDGDPLFGNNVSFLIPNAGAGIYLQHERFYLGASMPELLRYKSNLYDRVLGDQNLFRHYYLTAGCLFPLGRDVKLKPSVLVKHLPGVPFQFDLNTNVILKDLLFLGVSYRTEDAAIGMIEWQLNPQLRLGYAYGTTVGGLQSYNRGTHEFMIGYRFGYQVKTPGIIYF